MSKANRHEENEEIIVHVDSREIHFSHPSKIYFPESGISKGDVLAYYKSMYKYILPYLKDRPESMRRNPNGIADEGFYQKNASEDTPSWVKTYPVHTETEHKIVNYIICNDQATLFYLNNLGCIELNPWFSRIQHPDRPDYLVIDIDPSPGNTFDQVVDAALAVKEVLDKAGAECYCKTSGATGMHVYVPLGARYIFEESKDFAHILAARTQELLPDTTSLERSLQKRGERIYLDFLQNRIGQTLASAYSLRPKPGATASAPLLWKEVRHGLHPAQFDIHTLPKRVEKTGDLFAGVLGKGVDIRKCLKNLGA